MNLSSIVKRMKEEINGENRKDAIDLFEEMLIENIEELSNNNDFFHLPLKNILSILTKVDFALISEKIPILKNIAQNTILAHFEEKETLFLLYNIYTTENSISFEDIFAILKTFTNCPFLNQFCLLYNEKQKMPEIDYEYEIELKNKEIERLKLQISHSIKTEKPKAVASDIFNYCRKGELKCVQYLIDEEKVDVNIRDEQGKTPLHYACAKDHLPIVVFLISKGAQINAKDGRGWTPLHYAASSWGCFDVVEYLVNRGAKKNVKNAKGLTPYNLAKFDETKRILKTNEKKSQYNFI